MVNDLSRHSVFAGDDLLGSLGRIEIHCEPRSNLPISISGDYGETTLPRTSEADPVCLLFTGGTTGVSKGVTLSHRNVFAVLNGLSEIWSLRQVEERFLQILPMTHSGGLNCGANSAISCGSETVILRKFDPTKLIEMVEKYKITAVAGVQQFTLH